MGYGDYIFWTATIRDIIKKLKKINDINEKLKFLESLKCKDEDDIGVLNIKFTCDETPFKFFLFCSNLKNSSITKKFTNHIDCEHIFKNNPNVTSDMNYKNIIYFKIMSNFYWKKDSLELNVKRARHYVWDDHHWVKILADKFKLKDYELQGEIFFTKEEFEKVKNYLPKEEFIFVNYQCKVESRSYPKEKMQEVVNYLTLKKKIKCVQIIPDSFRGVKFHELDNVDIIKNKFDFREALCFASHSKFAILNHGGLSNGLACFRKKTICLYSNLFNPISTKTDSEIPYLYSNHGEFCYDYKCKKCIELIKNSNPLDLINVIENILVKDNIKEFSDYHDKTNNIVNSYIIWTGIIKNISKKLDKMRTITEKLNYFEKIKCKNDGDSGILNIKFKRNEIPFKFILYCNDFESNSIIEITKDLDIFGIFNHNTYLTNNSNYENLIYFKIIDIYNFDPILKLKNGNIEFTNISIKKNLSNKFEIDEDKLNGEFFFTKKEINKVKEYIPNEDFVFIDYQSNPEKNSYSIEKMQKIVDYLKNKILCIEVIPKHLKNFKIRKLDNILSYQNIFTLRESILFASYAKTCILNYGIISNSISSFKIKTICLTENIFDSLICKDNNIVPFLYLNNQDFFYLTEYNTILNMIFNENTTKLIEVLNNNLYL